MTEWRNKWENRHISLCRRIPNNQCRYSAPWEGRHTYPLLKSGLCLVASFQRIENMDKRKEESLYSPETRPTASFVTSVHTQSVLFCCSCLLAPDCNPLYNPPRIFFRHNLVNTVIHSPQVHFFPESSVNITFTMPTWTTLLYLWMITLDRKFWSIPFKYNNLHMAASKTLGSMQSPAITFFIYFITIKYIFY